ncbi:MAG: Fic family protein [Chloroflexota bacterium]|nr:Fic family protein [Chloroflexota bacterium]
MDNQLSLTLERRRQPGRMVTAGPCNARYPAFVPDQLPPVIEYGGQLMARLSEGDRALGELNGLGRMLPNPGLLINPFIRKEAVLSSKIEGTRATITDLYAREAGQGANLGPTSDVDEVLNYVRALDYGLDRISSLPISLRFMRELHERLMRGVRREEMRPGVFRTSQNWIGPPGSVINNASYVPPPPQEMMETLGQFEMYLHADDARNPPLVRLALIHVQFEMIHPFLDGNGRVGRLLITLLLVHWQLLTLPLLYLSAFFERRRDEYYRRLSGVSHDGDWEGWIAYFLEGVRDESRDAANRAKRLQDLQQDWRDQVTGTRSSALTLKVVDHLFEAPIITIPGIQALLGNVTYPTARKHVEKLLSAGILQPFGEKSYGRSFIARDILTTIDR